MPPVFNITQAVKCNPYIRGSMLRAWCRVELAHRVLERKGWAVRVTAIWVN